VAGNGETATWSSYTGTNLNALPPVANSYDLFWGSVSRHITVPAGVPLQIAVDGYPGWPDGASGIINLQLTFEPTP
jgi:hypothetical protein